MRDSKLRFSCLGLSMLCAACTPREQPAPTGSVNDREPTLTIPRAREATVAASDGSLAALTAEVRELRVAVEQLGRTQTQTQALGVYLSAQQTRIAQAEQRLDAARTELDTADSRNRELETGIARMSEDLASATDRDQRARLDEGIRNFKAEQSRLVAQLEQARNRERDLAGELQVEERRWNELITRIERLAQ